MRYCLNTEQLHEVTPLNVDKSIKNMATKMHGCELLVKISGGDLIALEAEHHINCLTIYRNRYHTFSTQNASKQASRQARGHAFFDVVVQKDEALSQGIYSFTFGKLRPVYEKKNNKYFLNSEQTTLKVSFLIIISTMEYKNIVMDILRLYCTDTT